jgi:Domain of unknown function (DUF1840)
MLPVSHLLKGKTMIYEFKSKATGNLIMTAPVAQMILKSIDKADGPTGIITVAQLPASIAQLKLAMIASKAKATPKPDDETEQAPVSLSQRALPFLEMLERALTAKEDVVWGV